MRDQARLLCYQYLDILVHMRNYSHVLLYQSESGYLNTFILNSSGFRPPN
jgi:hypothetical protein